MKHHRQPDDSPLSIDKQATVSTCLSRRASIFRAAESGNAWYATCEPANSTAPGTKAAVSEGACVTPTPKRFCDNLFSSPTGARAARASRASSNRYPPILMSRAKRSTAQKPLCQACGKTITGKVHRFSGVPDSAFCSFQCQLSKAEIQVVEAKLEPITSPLPPQPVHTGPTARTLRYERECECGVFYENQITVPNRHSLICFCPKCGCVTQD